MKKTLALFLTAGCLLTLSGCSIGDIVDRFIPANDSAATAESASSEGTDNASSHTRVYMDEVRGTLAGFTGNQATLLKEEDTYVFDISQATIECEAGMVCGDAVSVIYEGQLDGTSTDSVRALKVVNTRQEDSALEEQTFHGQIQSLTSNSVTLKGEDGKTVIFPAIGITQYYQAGIKTGNWVYVHYQGNLTSSSDSASQSGALTNVVSISDVEPLVIASATPTPTPDPESTAETQVASSFRGVIQSVSLNTLEVSVENTSNIIKLDMSAVPCYFSGGITVGSHVTVHYLTSTGFNGTTTEGISVTGIDGEIPENMRESNLDFSFTGEIIGSTSNTITVLTSDGMQVTCYTDDAANSSTGGLLTGSSVKVSFNPAVSRNTNILTAIKITDA